MIKLSPVVTMLKAPSLDRLARQNAVLRAAIETVAPEYFALRDQLETLVRTARELKAVPTDDDLRHELEADLAAGKGLPADLLARIAATGDGGTAMARARRVLDAIANDLQGKADNALRSDADAIMHHLHGLLSQTIAQAAEVRDAPTTAEDAIAAGPKGVARYEKLRAVEARYAEIRAAQSAMVQLWDIEKTGPDSWWSVVGFIRSPRVAWEHVVDWHRRGYRIEQDGRARDAQVKLTPPWPALDTAEGLHWLVDHPEASPWVPTREQYTETELRLEMSGSLAGRTSLRSRGPQALGGWGRQREIPANAEH